MFSRIFQDAGLLLRLADLSQHGLPALFTQGRGFVVGVDIEILMAKRGAADKILPGFGFQLEAVIVAVPIRQFCLRVAVAIVRRG